MSDTVYVAKNEYQAFVKMEREFEVQKEKLDKAERELAEALDVLFELWRTTIVFAPGFVRGHSDQQAIDRATDLLVASGRMPQSFTSKESEDSV
jgi:hypothetical protein